MYSYSVGADVPFTGVKKSLHAVKSNRGRRKKMCNV